MIGLYDLEALNANIRKGTPLPVFQSVGQFNGLITFTWSAAGGQTFQVQYNSDLTTTNWNNLGDTITATNETMSASDALGRDIRRLYRLKPLP